MKLRSIVWLAAFWQVVASGFGADPAPIGPYETSRFATPIAEIDRLAFAPMRDPGIEPARPCSDEVFLRRVYLDVAGRIPTLAVTRAFLCDPAADRRSRLIDQLLGSEDYVDDWTMRWCDVLRVKSEFPINLWPDSVQAYHRWIREQVASNRPYDEMATEMLTASGSNFRDPAVNFFRAVSGKGPEPVAAWLTTDTNPRFAEAGANRIWAWVFGRGVVHEPDDMRTGSPPTVPGRLEHLGKTFAADGYDHRKLLPRILNSRVYQLSSIPRSKHERAAELFASYPIRRLEAEVLLDVLCSLTATSEGYMSPIPEPFTHVPPSARSVRLADDSITSPFLEMFGRSSRDTGQLMERSNDHAAARAMKVRSVANGRIDQAGDCDIYRIDAKAGQPLTVEVVARRLGSPLDAVVHVAAADGQVIGWNDDQLSKDGHLHLDDGLLTHHADPRLTIKPATDGPLWIRVADTRHAGGSAYGYRLRVTPQQPDFELRVSPSGLSTTAGRHTPISVHVMRRHGFEGEIRLALADAPKGFGLSGAVIPAGADGCRLTLDVPPKFGSRLCHPTLIGTATEEGKPVTRGALPTDDRMQAFLWRHLVDAEEWLVQVRGQSAPITRIGKGLIHLPVGGSSVVRFKAWKDLAQRISTEPSAAPVGLTVSQPKGTKGGFSIKIQAPNEIESGERFNLIVDLYQAKNGQRSASAKFPNNSLPALPILITQPRTP